jgi:hypothetical protein
MRAQNRLMLPDPGCTLHAPAAGWMSNEPEPASLLAPAPAVPVAQGERKRVVL